MITRGWALSGQIGITRLQKLVGIRFEKMEHTGGGCFTAYAAGHAIGPFYERGGRIVGNFEDLYIGPEEDY
jgi:hypothetical protein